MTGTTHDERDELRDATRGFLARHRPATAVREALERPRVLDRAAWRAGAGMGWVGAALPDEVGGLGGTVADLAAIAEELGRATFDGPFLGCVLAATTLASASGAEAVLADLCGGERTATLLVAAGDADPDVAAARVIEDGGGRFHGTLDAVLDADVADVLVVPLAATATRGDAVALVAADAPGVAVETARGFDLTRRVAAVRLTGAAGTVLPLAPDALTRTLALGGTLAAADALGAATRLQEMTVAYAQDRIAFGRSIASYQAVKHKCADMLCWTESSRVAVDGATGALDGDGADPAYAVSVAKAYAGDACSRVAGEALQLHGGIAFTWEHDLHLLLRRIKADEVLFGAVAWHEDRLGALAR